MGKSSIKCSRVPAVFVKRVCGVSTHDIFILPRNLEHGTKQTELYRSILIKDGFLLVPGYTMHPGTTPELFPVSPPAKRKIFKKVNVIFLNVPGKNELLRLLFLGKMVYTCLIRGFPRFFWLMCSGVKTHFSHVPKNTSGGFYDVRY